MSRSYSAALAAVPKEMMLAVKNVRYLLVGGGLAANQAARLIRMKDEQGTITLVSKEAELPYDRPPLSKEFLRGAKQPDDVYYDTVAWYAEQRIETILGSPVVRLDVDARTVTLKSGERVAFEKALLATGGEPLRLEVPGVELDGVHYLRTLDDARRLSAIAQSGRSAVVVGAGFIGMEVAASLTQLGVRVTVVERLPYIWPDLLDESLAMHLRDYGADRGIRFFTGDTIVSFDGKKRVRAVHTANGRRLPCDFVCIGIGIAPSVDLATDAGLEVSDGIIVDEHMETSCPGIYAAGDVVNFPDPVFGKRRRVEHWGHAEYSGQIAGLNMAGTPQQYDLLSYVWSDIFDLHIECAGDVTLRDRTLIRGDLEATSFTVLYLADDRLVAYLAVNANKREFPKLQRLIRKHVDLGGHDNNLSDPAFDLKSLL